MGAEQSAVRQDKLAQVASSEVLDGADELWTQLELCEITASRKGTSEALDKATSLWASSLCEHQASGNFRALLQHLVRIFRPSSVRDVSLGACSCAASLPPLFAKLPVLFPAVSRLRFSRP